MEIFVEIVWKGWDQNKFQILIIVSYYGNFCKNGLTRWDQNKFEILILEIDVGRIDLLGKLGNSPSGLLEILANLNLPLYLHFFFLFGTKCITVKGK